MSNIARKEIEGLGFRVQGVTSYMLPLFGLTQNPILESFFEGSKGQPRLVPEP